MARSRVLLVSVITAGIFYCHSAFAQTHLPLQVSSAFALERPLREIAAAYTRKTGTAVSLSFSGSADITKEVQEGSRPNVVVCARRWLDELTKTGRLTKKSAVDLASTRLVLIAPVAATVPLRVREGFSLSETIGESHLAIGDPKIVPSGYYGKIAISRLGGWLQVGPKVARSDVVRTVIDMVANGTAILGVVYDTDVKADPRVKIVGYFPETQYPTIDYAAALTAGPQPSEADGFMRFLQGPEATSTFMRLGFITVRRTGAKPVLPR